jgi:Flp pilus assembly protein TadD
MSRTAKTSKPVGKSRVVGVSIALFILVWLIFGRTVRYDFVNYDDKTYVYGNPAVVDGLTLKSFLNAFVNTSTGNWHPLTMISHMLDAQLYGLKAGGHHFTNTLLHSIAVVLLFLFLQQITNRFWASGFTAAVFAIHPLRVESVAWIAERKDVLSAVFFMLTLMAYARYVGQPSLRRYATMSMLFVCGLMCKPMLVTTPFVLLLLDYWPLKRITNGMSAILEKLPLFLLSVASSVVTFVVQEHSPGAIAQLPLNWRIENALVSYVTYIYQMIWPDNLAVFYPHPGNRLGQWKVITAGVLLVGITLVALVVRRTRPYLLVGWLWYVGMLVPVIGIVEVGLQGHADRYTYLPQIGLYLAVTWFIADVFAKISYRRQILIPSAALIIIAFSACSWKQMSYWRNSETLWTHTLAVTRDNDVAQTNYGMFLMDRGELDAALSHFRAALEIRSSESNLHYNLSLALIETDIGNALARKADLDAALPHLQRAVKLQPDYADAHYNLGAILFQKDDLDEAIAEWRKALSIRPEDPDTHTSLGNALVRKGRITDAAKQYEDAIKIDARSILALNNLAWLLCTSPDQSLRNGPKALECAQRADTLTNGKNLVFLRTLAAAFAENGRWSEAIRAAERGAELARSQNNLAFAGQFAEDISLYRAGLPLRDNSLSNAH